MRTWLIVVHRYVGLTIATFLVVAGVTGSALAFNHELDAAVNPGLFYVAPSTPDAVMLDPFVLRERAETQLATPVHEVSFLRPAGMSVVVGIDTEKGWRQFFIDPYTGAVLGSRTWGAISEGVVNLMPFIYRLHYQLALGTVGSWLFGIIALLWTVDCFIGFYLTLPARRNAAAMRDGRTWLARWKPSWLVKGSSMFGAVFTFHRASGLWTWPLLFVFAWSGVGFNLTPVFMPVMGAFGTNSVSETLPTVNPPKKRPTLTWHEAESLGRQYLTEDAAANGFVLLELDSMSYRADQGLFQLSARSSNDRTRNPGLMVWLDGDHGALVAKDGRHRERLGDSLSNWLFALHMGTVGGLAYRIIVCVMGVIIAILSITGVIIWWKKRELRVKVRCPTTTAGA